MEEADIRLKDGRALPPLTDHGKSSSRSSSLLTLILNLENQEVVKAHEAGKSRENLSLK